MSRIVRIALEGPNGVGKSHVIRCLQSVLATEGIPTHVTKAGGLPVGSPAREQLRQLSQKVDSGQATEEEKTTLESDSIFRKASSQAIDDLEATERPPSHLIFDRTPLMSWIFKQAHSPNNRYLDEIRDDALAATRRLSLDRLYLIEVAPEVLYARIIARSLKHDPELSCKELLDLTQAPPSIKYQMGSMVEALMCDPVVIAKPMSRGDFVSYAELSHQMRVYREVAAEAGDILGCGWRIVDNAGSPEELVEQMEAGVHELLDAE